MTDREYLVHLRDGFVLSQSIAPFVSKQRLIDSINAHLDESRRKPHLTPIGAGTVTNGYGNMRNPDVCVHGVNTGNGMVSCARCNDPAFDAAKGPSPYQTFTLTGKPVGPPNGTTYMVGGPHDTTAAQTQTLPQEVDIGGGYVAYPNNAPKCTICGEPNFSIPRMGIYHVCKEQEPQQEFWRCEHYPEAIQNWYAGRKQCEFSCNLSELRWHDNGTCKPQTS